MTLTLLASLVLASATSPAPAHRSDPLVAQRADATPRPAAAKPLFRDPIHDGAADPVVIWNPRRGRWWMFYTNRRAAAPGLSGVAWVHGTRIGIAESADAGATWSAAGTAEIELPPELGGAEPTHWAPEVITAPDGTHHMFLTVVPGVFEDWQHPRSIVHLTSTDLRHWRGARPLALASDRVIDACLLRLADGSWRLWYNNERDHKSIAFADSRDLASWTDRGKAVGDQAGEGPKVFRWKGAYWMITDVWSGLAVYRSDDALDWKRQPGGNLLERPGRGADDGVKGGHPDVVVNGDRAYLFYFTHPGRADPRDTADGYEQRRSSIQVAELREEGGRLTCDRDAPTDVELLPPGAGPPALVGLDHVPVAVSDLEAAAERYRQLGFVLKPGRPHANGIRNRHVKFNDGTELELITAPEARDALTTSYRRHLSAGDGPAFAAFFAPEPDQVVERLASLGITGKREPGGVVVSQPEALRYVFFGQRNRSPTDRPEHFAHPNGAEALTAVWLANDDSSAERALLAGLGARLEEREVCVPDPRRATTAWLREGQVLLLGGDRQLVPGRRVVGVTLRVRDLARTLSLLSKVPGAAPLLTSGRCGNSLFLAPAAAHGLWLEWREQR